MEFGPRASEDSVSRYMLIFFLRKAFINIHIQVLEDIEQQF